MVQNYNYANEHKYTTRAYQRNSGGRGKFLFRGLIFPENVGGGEGDENFFPDIKKRVKKIFYSKFFSGKIPVTTWVEPFFSINKCKILV
jgi:hypothetical protein